LPGILFPSGGGGSGGSSAGALKEQNESRNRPIYTRVLFVPLRIKLVSYLRQFTIVMKYTDSFSVNTNISCFEFLIPLEK